MAQAITFRAFGAGIPSIEKSLNGWAIFQGSEGNEGIDLRKPFIGSLLGRGLFALGFKRILRLHSQPREGFWLVNCEVCKHLPVQLYAGKLQPVHKLRIVDSIQPGGGANAYNPETAKVTLLQLSAGVSEIQPTLNRLLRRAIQLRLCAAITFRELQYFLAPFETLVSSFCPWHCSIPLLRRMKAEG